ncbi:MAG: hypothetical protein H7Y17_14970 [Chlorobia bacterium]|nr:hypothetical protein [Fimbriimonadaceae bacterium]
MRKRWVWIGVATTALILVAFAIISRETDGLDFIRKYRPDNEFLRSYESELINSEYTVTTTHWTRVFDFGNIPPELVRELRAMTDGKSFDESPHLMLPDNRIISCREGEGRVYVELSSEPSWFDRQWQALMARIYPDHY